jgi:hypothetical protein
MNHYTKEQVEQIVRAYHDWVSNFGAPDDDGNDRDLQLAGVTVYSHLDEDGDQMPFSEAIHVFFSEHVFIDEEGHPVTTPFDDVLVAIKEGK